MKAFIYYECMQSIALAAQRWSQRTTGYGHYAAWSTIVRVAKMARQHEQAPVFYARLYDEPGVIARIDRALSFMDRAGTVTIVEPDMVNFCTTHGRVPQAEAGPLLDAFRGQHEYLTCQMGG